MATLQSPGVQVNIINESFYTPAAPGTVPLIFVASASDKVNPSGTVAAGTTAANAGKVYYITSQRDLVDTFGTPIFYTDANGNPVHGGELNEYGLQAAYSLLGVSSAAYVVRVPVDLSSLSAKSSAPAGAVADKSYWINTADSKFGIFEWNATKGTFTNKVPLVIDDSNASLNYDSGNSAPKASFGLVGQYAIVFNQPNQSEVHVFYKNSDANWVEVGSRGGNEFAVDALSNTFVSTVWSTSWPAVKGTATTSSLVVSTASTFTINGVSVGIQNSDAIADIAEKINNTFHESDSIGAKVNNGYLEIFSDAPATESFNLVVSADITSQLGISSGAYQPTTVFVGPHTQYPDFGDIPSGSVYIKTTSPNAGADWIVKQWNASSNAWNTVRSPIYHSTEAATYNLDKVSGGASIPVGTLFVESNFNHGNNTSDVGAITANFKAYRRNAVAPTSITSEAKGTTVSFSTQTVTLTIETTSPGSSGFVNAGSVSITTGGDGVDKLVQAINNSGIAHISAVKNEVVEGSSYSITITHDTGGEIRFTDNSNILGTAGFTASTENFYTLDSSVEPTSATHKASNWKPLTFTANLVAPSSDPANGQLWYSSIIDQVDIMYHNGTTWVGYKNAFNGTDPNGPIVSATRPTTQSDGLTALANGDIWVSTAGGIDRYGKDIYVFDGNSLEWVPQDTADQTSPNGWVFADARWADSGESSAAASIKTLLSSNYLDPDAPDPDLYPRGTRLWNLRRSGFNVKRFVPGYIDILANDGKNLRFENQSMAAYNADRWVSVSPNNADGSGTFGRFAQRSFVVASLKAMVDGNQSVRDTDTLTFNLIATPGYPELIQNMISLNIDRGLTAFVVGDTSMRLKPTGTDLAAYGLNSNGAFDNGEDGLVSYNEYMAVFYPSGYTNDLSGNYVVVPPTHMMLRTIAISDQKSYPWFAPAGIRRGVVDNVTSVGYLENGEFKATALPENIRNVMATKGKINPIATITGAGIINFGQYTRANAASALDRINVARLVCHLRRQLDILARPFLFEPNDKITRNEIKNAVQKLLLELVGQRALYDFIVVCDESNNTPARIDRSELWVDIAIEPVKAVEFIYIPVRLVNTGAIKAGTYTLA